MAAEIGEETVKLKRIVAPVTGGFLVSACVLACGWAGWVQLERAVRLSFPPRQYLEYFETREFRLAILMANCAGLFTILLWAVCFWSEPATREKWTWSRVLAQLLLVGVITGVAGGSLALHTGLNHH